MEKYEIQKTLPRGVHGHVLIARLESEKKKYAMKMVECPDEGYANQAVREGLFMTEMDHPNICKYKELFVTWDKTISAVYVCLVMDYYAIGDLSSLFHESRYKQEKIREMVIKNWIGQMVDALVYIHSNNHIHRNLKPSNILRMDDLSYVIGDFSVATFMNDEIKLGVRSKGGSSLWLAPEALNNVFSKKSDLWAMGCILLDMMTCGLMSTQELLKLLQYIREDPMELRAIIDVLHKKQLYTNSLCEVLFMLLQIDPEDRTTAMGLTSLHYIRECLVICGSSLSGLKRSPQGVFRVPYGAGIEKLLEFMHIHAGEVEIQKLALKYLIAIVDDQEGLLADTRIIPVLITALKIHSDSLEIQLQVCRVLLRFVTKATEENVEEGDLFGESVIQTMLGIMRTRHQCMDLEVLVCNIIMMLSGSLSAAKLIGTFGGIQEILYMLYSFKDSSHICTPCCSALWSIVVDKYNAQIAQREGALDKVCKVLEWHIHNGTVVEAACSAIWALALEERLTDNKSELLTLLLIKGLRIHLRKDQVVKNIHLLLSCLIHKSELAAFRILVPYNESDGLSLIINSYSIHREDPEIVENICNLFSELVQYKDVGLELLSQNIVKLLNEIKVKYTSNEDISNSVETILLKLQSTQAGINQMLEVQTERDITESQSDRGLSEGNSLKDTTEGQAEGEIIEGQIEGGTTEGQTEGGTTEGQAEGGTTEGQEEGGTTVVEAKGGTTEGQAVGITMVEAEGEAEGGITVGEAEGGITVGEAEGGITVSEAKDGTTEGQAVGITQGQAEEG